MTEAELAAIEGLDAGDLHPLAGLLAEDGDRMHPAIMLRLRMMIVGTADQIDWRLKIARHPDLGRGQANAERSTEIRKELHTALIMVREGALCEGGFGSAVNATAAKLGIGESTVERHWTNQREHILNDIRAGIIDPRILPGPIAAKHQATPGQWVDFG